MGGFQETSWERLTIPIMSMTGSKDDGADYFGDQSVERRRDAFRFSPKGDKYLLFLEGANHGSFGGRPGGPGEEKLSAEKVQTVTTCVKAASLAFWDAYLKDSGQARAYLQANAIAEHSQGDVRLETK